MKEAAPKRPPIGGTKIVKKLDGLNRLVYIVFVGSGKPLAKGAKKMKTQEKEIHMYISTKNAQVSHTAPYPLMVDILLFDGAGMKREMFVSFTKLQNWIGGEKVLRLPVSGGATYYNVLTKEEKVLFCATGSMA